MGGSVNLEFPQSCSLRRNQRGVRWTVGAFSERVVRDAKTGAEKVLADLDAELKRAQDAKELSSALGRLPDAFTIVFRHIDIASWFAGAGGVLIAVAVLLTLWWNRVRPAPPATGRRAVTDP